MHAFIRSLLFISALVTCTPLVAAQDPAPAEVAPPAPPVALYLTWQRDPAHTMTVHWHTVWRDGFRDTVLEYRPAGTGDAGMPWHRATGDSQPMPFSERIVHTVELTGLSPDTTYEFRLGTLVFGKQAEAAFVAEQAVHRFRTLPAKLERPVRFLFGGDAYGEGEVFAAMNRVVAARDPEFALMGGDIAYANGNPETISRWFEFFRIWTETMVTSDGRLIPLVPAIGNHEVHGDTFKLRGAVGVGMSPERAPEFYAVFSFPGRPGYNVLDFGDYLSVIALDSGHTAPVSGAQTDWLRQVLGARRSIRYLVPIYHVGAYPSVRAFDGKIATEVRTQWVPLFEEAGVRFAFENHDHAYKVTHPLRAGKIDPSGIRYIGDGAWAVKPRATHPRDKAPYLERAESRNHVFLVTLDPAQAEFTALDPTGAEFDRFTIPARR